MKKISISQLSQQCSVQFGTSGVRGRVEELTDEVCWIYATAFLLHLKSQGITHTGMEVGVAGDYRYSTNRIMLAVADAIACQELKAVNYGKIPSPAIALLGLNKSIPTIMVTGSHIPDDRNGIKFNKPDGEILKVDEESIVEIGLTIPEGKFDKDGVLLTCPKLSEVNDDARVLYIDRFLDFFSKDCLQGKKIGLYEHSSVSRECIKEIMTSLGAEVLSLGYSDKFVSVDTEAIRPEDIVLAKEWSDKYGLDSIISTDGDGDRPLVSDEHGNWLRGDVAAVLCAQYLKLEAVVTPVSSNSAVEKSHVFEKVIRTRIGSPFVISGMQSLVNKYLRVGGYEANGGFLQQTELTLSGRTLSALPTRDAIIVQLCILMMTQDKECTISELVADLPSRYTKSDRIKDFPTEMSQQLLQKMMSASNDENLKNIDILFHDVAGKSVTIDSTDGIRIMFENEDIIHLRPSGNAPELRCYNESATVERAEILNMRCMTILESWKNND